MAETNLVGEQLKRIGFNTQVFNRAETEELSTIILPDEEIFECANGWYEGGFALIVATNFRILLIDKKPFKFLTVEDIRFDMISEIDYSHRLFDARIHISSGTKNMVFRSLNQQRLRKLITHVQHRMAEQKTEQRVSGDRQHDRLKQIDEKLQTYLIAQYQQSQSLNRRLTDYEDTDSAVVPATPEANLAVDTAPKLATAVNGVTPAELYEEGRKEIFKVQNSTPQATSAFSRLPDIFRHRQFGRTLLHGLMIHPAEAVA
jgi:hypothetical protein